MGIIRDLTVCGRFLQTPQRATSQKLLDFRGGLLDFRGGREEEEGVTG